MKILYPLLTLIAFSQLTGCSLFRPSHCNPQGASDLGYREACSGAVTKPSRGKSCNEDDYKVSDFLRDYDAGFNKGVEVTCTREHALEIASTDSASPTAYSPNVFAVCGSKATSLRDAYEKEYRVLFCTESNMGNLGEAAAAGFGVKNTSLIERRCGSSNKAALTAYDRGYDRAIRSLCTASEFANLGTSDARANKSMENGYGLARRCPSEIQGPAIEAYSRAYNDARATIAREQELANQKKQLEDERKKLEAEKAKLRN